MKIMRPREVCQTLRQTSPGLSSGPTQGALDNRAEQDLTASGWMQLLIR